MSSLGDMYAALYATICGQHPTQRPWHFQWLSTVDLHRDLRELLAQSGGNVLDLGCGTKPYRHWLGPQLRSYVGADISPLPGVDVVLTPGDPLPFAEASFDTVLCTQVLEHVANAEAVLGEIARVLRPGGTLIVSVPFIYHLHGAPHDHRRLSEFGVCGMLQRDFKVVELRRQGRIGSTLVSLGLGWLETQTNGTRLSRFAKASLFPFWVALCGVANLLARGLDRLDTTGHFYHNTLALAERRGETPET